VEIVTLFEVKPMIRLWQFDGAMTVLEHCSLLALMLENHFYCLGVVIGGGCFILLRVDDHFDGFFVFALFSIFLFLLDVCIRDIPTSS
jgi:hypothetical protein